MDDSEIVALYWARSEQALRETDRKFGSFCRAIARRIVPDARDAEECVNDTWLAAWNAMPTARPPRLAAFLGRITRNLALDRYEFLHAKKRCRETDLLLSELEECLPARSGTETEWSEQETIRQINEFLLKEDEINRNIFLRRYWFADPVKAICRRYDMSESKVKSILYRMRLRLKQRLLEGGTEL